MMLSISIVAAWYMVPVPPVATVIPTIFTSVTMKPSSKPSSAPRRRRQRERAQGSHFRHARVVPTL